jgi:hypothetical protein
MNPIINNQSIAELFLHCANDANGFSYWNWSGSTKSREEPKAILVRLPVPIIQKERHLKRAALCC